LRAANPINCKASRPGERTDRARAGDRV